MENSRNGASPGAKGTARRVGAKDIMEVDGAKAKDSTAREEVGAKDMEVDGVLNITLLPHQCQRVHSPHLPLLRLILRDGRRLLLLLQATPRVLDPGIPTAKAVPILTEVCMEEMQGDSLLLVPLGAEERVGEGAMEAQLQLLHFQLGHRHLQ